MAQEELHLIPTGDLTSTAFGYKIQFDGRQRKYAGVAYRFGHSAFSGPVALKTAGKVDVTGPRLRREADASRHLGALGGELISKCLAYEFTDERARILVSHRGRPLTDLVADHAHWPPSDGIRRKMIIDLLQGLEILRLKGIVHGAIDIRNLHWDGSTLQLTDLSTAALLGRYPDGSPAHHGDDVLGAGRVIYRLLAGAPPPDDPAALRDEIEHIQDARLAALLLRRDLVTRTDLDYVFADDPATRPTARTLLHRLDSGPHGVQWEQLAAREAEVRADFRRLRRAQSRFRDEYRAWQEGRATPRPPTAGSPRPWMVPPQATTPSRPARRVRPPAGQGAPAEPQPLHAVRTWPAPPRVPRQPPGPPATAAPAARTAPVRRHTRPARSWAPGWTFVIAAVLTLGTLIALFLAFLAIGQMA